MTDKIRIKKREVSDFTEKEWIQITESIEEESIDVGRNDLVELWIDTQLDMVKKEGREMAFEYGYLVDRNGN